MSANVALQGHSCLVYVEELHLHELRGYSDSLGPSHQSILDQNQILAVMELIQYAQKMIPTVLVYPK
jgi:hypothetical protein